MAEISSWQEFSGSELPSTEESTPEEFFEEEIAKLHMCEAEDEDEISCVFSHIYKYLSDCSWDADRLKICNQKLWAVFMDSEKAKLFAINKSYIECLGRLRPECPLKLLEVYAPYLQQLSVFTSKADFYVVKPIYVDIKRLCVESEGLSREVLTQKLKKIVPNSALKVIDNLLANNRAMTPTKSISKWNSQTSLRELERSAAKNFAGQKCSSAFKKSENKPMNARRESYTLVPQSNVISESLIASVSLDTIPGEVCKVLF